MKRPLHLLISGLIAAVIGGFGTSSLWGNQGLERLGLVVYVPVLIAGLFWLVAYAVGRPMLKRFKSGEIYALGMGVAVTAFMILFVLGLI